MRFAGVVRALGAGWQQAAVCLREGLGEDEVERMQHRAV